jgi:hypothetical protein
MPTMQQRLWTARRRYPVLGVTSDQCRRASIFRFRDLNRYLIVYDYGMGALWGYVLASSAEEITDRYPEVQVVDGWPESLNEADRELLERRIEDVHDPLPTGVLGAIHMDRREPEGPTNLQRLVEWHRETRGLEWSDDPGMEMRVIAEGGWRFRIALRDEELAKAPTRPVDIRRSEDDWIRAQVENGAWIAEYGPLSEDEAVGLFLAWVSRDPTR